MKLKIDNNIKNIIIINITRILGNSKLFSDAEIFVARSANALPVYSDFTGTLGITPEGIVVYYDSELGQVKEIADRGWCMVAAVSAARRYANLDAILPTRPSTAQSCPVCRGTGRVLPIKAICGSCFGLGWLSNE